MKDLNDHHGHNAGDTALQAVARALRQVIRRADVAARIGGDEFVALALGRNELDRGAIERRVRDYLASAHIIATVGRKVEELIGMVSTHA